MNMMSSVRTVFLSFTIISVLLGGCSTAERSVVQSTSTSMKLGDIESSPTPSPIVLPDTTPTVEPTPEGVSPSVHFFEFRVNDETCRHTGDGTLYDLSCEVNPGDKVTVFAEVNDDSDGDLHFLGDEFWYIPGNEAILEGSIPLDYEHEKLFFQLESFDGESQTVEITFKAGDGWAPSIFVDEPTGLTGEVSLEVRVCDLNGVETVISLTVEQEFNFQHNGNKKIEEYISNQDLAPFKVDQLEDGLWQVSFNSAWPGRFPLHFTAIDEDGNETTERIPVEIYWAAQPLEIRGVMVEGWAMQDPITLTKRDFIRLLDQLEEMNINYISLNPIWHLENANSDEFERAPSRWSPGKRFASMTDSQLITLTNLAHERGMGVMLKPMVFVLDYSWIGFVTPSDPQQWFDNYEAQILLPMAKLAEENDMEMLCLFNDSGRQNRYRDQWTRIIERVREQYSGQLTIADSNYVIMSDPLSFIELLDVYGAQGYLVGSGTSYPNLNGLMDPTVESMTRHMGMQHDRRETYVTSSGKKLILTELGGVNSDGMNQWPADTGNFSEMDNQERVNYHEASLRALVERDWVLGAFLWSIGASEEIHITDMGLSNDIRVAPIDDWVRIWFYDPSQ